MKKLDTQSRAMAAAIAGILAGAVLATACGGAAEAEPKAGAGTEANGCNGANGCSGEATEQAADHAEANGCNGANGCSGESGSGE
jgi:hypothetical protein